MSDPDGTPKSFLSFTNKCQYDIHLFLKEKGKYKSVHIGVCVVNKTGKDQNHDSSEMNACFEVHLTRLTENGSDSHFLVLCSDPCHPRYVRTLSRDTLKPKCCWNCHQCPTK